MYPRIPLGTVGGSFGIPGNHCHKYYGHMRCDTTQFGREVKYCGNLISPSSGQKMKTASVDASAKLHGVTCIGGTAEWDRMFTNISRQESERRCS
jgi:hypothetical protein